MFAVTIAAHTMCSLPSGRWPLAAVLALTKNDCVLAWAHMCAMVCGGVSCECMVLLASALFLFSTRTSAAWSLMS